MPEHDESNLPRWARDRMAGLRRELATARREAAALRGEFESEDEDGFYMRIDRGAARYDEPPVLALPAGPYRFTMKTPHGYGIEFSVHHGAVSARIQADPFTGAEALAVRPQASNVVLLRGEPLFPGS